MDSKEARILLARLCRGGQGFLSQRTLEALSVAVEALGGAASAAAQPVTAGFVGVLDLPTILYPGRGLASGLWMPPPETDVQRSWDRALAFRPLLLECGDHSHSDPLLNLIHDLLPGSWSVDPPTGAGPFSIRSARGDRLVIPADDKLFAIAIDEATNRATWALQFGADESEVVARIAPYAVAQRIEHSGNISAIDPKGRPATLNCGNVHERCYGLTPELRSMDDFHGWRHEVGRRLFCEILQEVSPRHSPEQAEACWTELGGAARSAWDRWLRALPGMRRLELAIAGFFVNGGAVACPALAIQGRDGSYPVSRRRFLEESFDHVEDVQRLCAPGLNNGWQQGILEYAVGRELLPILEAPRYLLSRPPRGIRTSQFCWIIEEHAQNPGDFECCELQVLEQTAYLEKSRLVTGGGLLSRCNVGSHHGHSAFGPWLIVDNPLSRGALDRYTVAPPSGHVAACWDPDAEQVEEIAGAHAPVVRPGQHDQQRCASAGIVLLPAP